MKMRAIMTRLYQFDELSDEAKNKALMDQVEFEIETMDENSPFYSISEEMERMQTPWFLGETIFHEHREELIETIKANKYEFFSNGSFYGGDL